MYPSFLRLVVSVEQASTQVVAVAAEAMAEAGLPAALDHRMIAQPPRPPPPSPGLDIAADVAAAAAAAGKQQELDVQEEQVVTAVDH